MTHRRIDSLYAGGLRKYHVTSCVLVAVAAGSIFLLVAITEGKPMTKQIRDMEQRAYLLYEQDAQRQKVGQQGVTFAEAWNLLERIQALDPMNARTRYIAGLIATSLNNEVHGRFLIEEAARLGDGMAASYIYMLTMDKVGSKEGCGPCNRVSGTGTGQTGSPSQDSAH